MEDFFPFPFSLATVDLHLCPGGDWVCITSPSGLRLLFCKEVRSHWGFLTISVSAAVPLHAYTTERGLLQSPSLPPSFLVSIQWRSIAKSLHVKANYP